VSEYCEECGRVLEESKIVWLELNNKTSRYHKPGEVKASESQGCFPFGTDCAENVLKREGEKS
jgi:hypothetical protein